MKIQDALHWENKQLSEQVITKRNAEIGKCLKDEVNTWIFKEKDENSFTAKVKE